MASFDYVESDSGSKIVLTARRADTKAIIDLTTFTAQVKFSVNGGARVTRSMTILDQTLYPGKAEYLFLASELVTDPDTPAVGQIVGEFAITDGALHVVTSLSKFKQNIRARLPA